MKHALVTGGSGGISGRSPRTVQCTSGDLVLLRNSADRFARRILNVPVDLDRLFTVFGLSDVNRTLDAIGAGAGRGGQRNAVFGQFTL